MPLICLWHIIDASIARQIAVDIHGSAKKQAIRHRVKRDAATLVPVTSGQMLNDFQKFFHHQTCQ